jgi:2-C-methyl-D-erythritol 4-phosphate cytidylyltransferase
MNLALPKQYLLIYDRPLLSYSINNLTQHAEIARVVVVLQDQDPHWCQQSLAHAEKVITAGGGESRMQSVLNGLRALSGLAADDDWVLVHDAARPCLAPDVLHRLMLAGDDVQGGVVLGLPHVMTI